MKQLILFLSLFFIGFTGNAQEKLAKIEFETETIDYGTIHKGADGHRVFKFKNTGDAPLIISDVQSTCGCTVPKKPQQPIMPGESGEIGITYNTNTLNPFRKTIVITTNTERGKIPLKIKGSVIDPNQKS